MNGRLKKVNNNLLVTLKHKGRCTTITKQNKQSINKLLRFHCISYIKTNKAYITYKSGKCTIPNLERNYKFLYWRDVR